MKAIFVELPAFNRNRPDYLTDDDYRLFQTALLESPNLGDVIQGTGGLRKVRWADQNRNKGKRGGIRVIYYWYTGGAEFWLFTIYDKDQAIDISPGQKKTLKSLLQRELAARK